MRIVIPSTLHRVQRQWLRDNLAEPFAGRTSVITHHGLLYQNGIAPLSDDDLNNAAYASNLEKCLGIVVLHFQGNTHESFDYTLGRTQVVVNPMSYYRGIKTATKPSDLRMEDAAFASHFWSKSSEN